MPAGRSDIRIDRYGPAGFTAAVVNVLALEYLVWAFILAWYLIPIIVLPVLIVDALVAWGLTRGGGTVAQIGRGMLIGCICAPLTVLVFAGAWVIAKAIGPI